jgi:hypothetical protein
MESTLVPLPLRVKASSLFNDRLLTPQPLNKSLDSTANISQRLANIEAFLQAALTPNHSPASNPTALAELKDSIQDIKDTIYGNHDHLSSEDLAERSNAKNRGLLFLCKLAEEWAKDSKYSSEFVERAVLGDEKGEGLVGLCRSIKDGIVKCGGWQQLENEKRELQRILRTCIDEIVAKRDLERENRHLDLELDRDMHDEEVAKLKMQNETLKMELCESRRGRMELVDKMLELDREVEEKDSALMEVLWPQGELSERKVVRRGRYRKDEMLAESRKLAGELGEKGWCGVM